MTEENERRTGVRLAEVLGLKPVKAKGWTCERYETTYGTKTALGLYRTIAAVMNERED
jgi:hypothetical protein